MILPIKLPQCFLVAQPRGGFVVRIPDRFRKRPWRSRNPLSAGCQLAAWSAEGLYRQRAKPDQAARSH